MDRGMSLRGVRRLFLQGWSVAAVNPLEAIPHYLRT